MPFKNLRAGPIIQAVMMILVIGLALTLGIQFLFVLYHLFGVASDLPANATQEEMQDRIQEELSVLLDETQEGSPTVNTLLIIQWGLVAAVTFGFARRCARLNSETPDQGTSYGLAIGFGVLMVYGLCICSAAVSILLQFVFLLLILAAGAAGGQLGGQAADPALRREPTTSDQPKPKRPFFTSSQPGVRPEIFYNMGVQAALGGRRDEARQHFTRAVQGNPRYVEAWLQLANLADTPEQAWNYIQQAWTISPHDPAVKQAVDVIWPQVAASAEAISPSRAQPPYPGGTQDDAAIPRSTLPAGIYADDLPLPPAEDEDGAPDETPRSPVP